MTSSRPIVSSAAFDAPVDAVWRAITAPNQMRQWFFAEMTDFEPKVGFETIFTVNCEGNAYPHVWKIIEVVPQQRIVYDWRYQGYPGQSTVTWELGEEGNRTKLVLTHEGIESFPQDNPVFSRESTQGGWDYFVCESLSRFLS